jgi:hypothetical protein
MQVQPTPIEEMAEAHTVPDKLKDLPFIELAMFLHYKLDGVPPGELEPEMLSAWIQEHATWAEQHRMTKLTYYAVSKRDTISVIVAAP